MKDNIFPKINLEQWFPVCRVDDYEKNLEQFVIFSRAEFLVTTFKESLRVCGEFETIDVA